MFRVKRPDVYKKRLDESDETSRRFFINEFLLLSVLRTSVGGFVVGSH